MKVTAIEDSGIRIVGFDLARAYAIFGMFIVNYNFAFGSLMAPTNTLEKFLNVFTGNSTAIFIICAGIGLSMMTSNLSLQQHDKKSLTKKVLRRSWFLFGLGLLLYPWWPGDILHFYGGYMHIATFILFIDKKFLLPAASFTILIYHLLLLIIPVGTGWNFSNYDYVDFWTPIGFLRNTLFNGWNSIFPWFAYFLLGMWLGKLDWRSAKVRRYVFSVGLFLFVAIEVIRYFAQSGYFSPTMTEYIRAEYFPPYLPFTLVTIGFALMVITACVWLGDRFEKNFLITALKKTGQMTLTHYVLHLTVGMAIIAFVTGKTYTGLIEDEIPTSAKDILLFSVISFLSCVVFSWLWSRKFSKGPIEILMRKISG